MTEQRPGPDRLTPPAPPRRATASSSQPPAEAGRATDPTPEASGDPGGAQRDAERAAQGDLSARADVPPRYQDVPEDRVGG